METLAVAGIGKSYDGNVALRENGAGKSTLMKILSGVYELAQALGVRHMDLVRPD